MPSRSPEESAHDVLAAEEFPMPAPDPAIHHGPVVLPSDPTGIEEPHDVLAAEEFPLPAGHSPRSVMLDAPRRSSASLLLAALGLLVLLTIARRRRAASAGLLAAASDR